jgi:zinc transport system substrate-binding protein
MRATTPFLAILLSLSYMFPAQAQAQLDIVTTIRPLQFIARAIAGDEATIESVIDINDSPHHFTLTPSDRLNLEAADLLIWSGPETELELADFFSRENIAAKSLTALALDSAIILQHEDGETDPHYWLEPDNALLVAAAVAEMLESLDPDNGERYRQNLDSFNRAIETSKMEIRRQLTVEDRPAIAVYHNAYQYFESHFDVSHVLDLVHNPELSPGMRETLTVRNALQSAAPDCLLLESDHNEALLQTLLQDNPLPSVEIDPLGYGIADSARAYTRLLESIAHAWASCQSIN